MEKSIEELNDKVEEITQQIREETSIDKKILLCRHKIRLYFQIREIEINNLRKK